MSWHPFAHKAVPPNPVADELRAQLAAERARNDELMRTIVELRREGFQPPPEQAPMSSEGYGLPAEVMHAIEQRAQTMHARERLVLGEKARVNGNVYYGVIEMAPGAVITGKLIPLNGNPALAAAGNPAENAAEVAAAKSGA